MFKLCGNGFTDKDEKFDRVSKIKKMLSKGLTSKHDTTSPFERLVNICKTSGDEILDDDGHTYEYRFHRRALEHYLNESGSVGYLNDIDDMILYLRVQYCGKCFLIPATTFVCMLGQFKGHNDIEPIDVSKFIRHSFPSDELFTLVYKDSGGYPMTMVLHMLRGSTGKEVREGHFICHDIDSLQKKRNLHKVTESFSKFGPGLVSNFSVPKGVSRLAFLSPREIQSVSSNFRAIKTARTSEKTLWLVTSRSMKGLKTLRKQVSLIWKKKIISHKVFLNLTRM